MKLVALHPVIQACRPGWRCVLPLVHLVLNHSGCWEEAPFTTYQHVETAIPVEVSRGNRAALGSRQIDDMQRLEAVFSAHVAEDCRLVTAVPVARYEHIHLAVVVVVAPRNGTVLYLREWRLNLLERLAASILVHLADWPACGPTRHKNIQVSVAIVVAKGRRAGFNPRQQNVRLIESREPIVPVQDRPRRGAIEAGQKDVVVPVSIVVADINRAFRQSNERQRSRTKLVVSVILVDHRGGARAIKPGQD